jgi:hypothetical protein
VLSTRQSCYSHCYNTSCLYSATCTVPIKVKGQGHALCSLCTVNIQRRESRSDVGSTIYHTRHSRPPTGSTVQMLMTLRSRSNCSQSLTAKRWRKGLPSSSNNSNGVRRTNKMKKMLVTAEAVSLTVEQDSSSSSRRHPEMVSEGISADFDMS